MASPVIAVREPAWRAESPAKNEAFSSGVSWPAVFAGAFVAAALSLILLALGTGLGLSAVSPWANDGASASTLGKSAIVWLILMEIIASSMGGYLAGRLRTKWASIHTDEVYFRDTAHGFLVWAVSAVITAAFLTSAAAGMIGGTARAGAAAAGPAALIGTEAPGRGMDPNAYFVDSLLRTNPTTNSFSAPDPNNPVASLAASSAATRGSSAGDPAVRGEVGMIFANALRKGELSPEDKTYVSQVVAARTGISEPDAEQRVGNVFTQIQQAADATRKAVAHTALWIFLALLIGAFCASLAATWGGAQRDHVVAV